jgi:hypothetical protein
MNEANKITSEGEIRALVIIYLERSNFMNEANKIFIIYSSFLKFKDIEKLYPVRIFRKTCN